MSRFAFGSALAFVTVVSATLIALFFLSVNEQQPPWEGCRAASKTEYESAKERYAVADYVVDQLKDHGDPWRLSEEAKPQSGPTT